MKNIFCILMFMIFATGYSQLAGYHKLGKTTVEKLDGGSFRIRPDKRENGIWSGSTLRLEPGNYILAFSCRKGSGGYVRAFVKNGDNAGVAFATPFFADNTNGGWKDLSWQFEVRKPGPHGSVWLVGDGEFQIKNFSFKKVPSSAELRLAAKLQRVSEPRSVLPAKLPDLRGVTLIAQEWHLWFAADVGAKQDDGWWQVWGDSHGRARYDYYQSSGPLWRRAFNDLVYPYLGPYSAQNEGIIRWQIRVMKACGLDGTLCQLYPEMGRGRYFCNLDLFETCLRIASEEGYHIAANDEIQFLPKSAQSVEAFVERALSLLKLAKKYKSFLRIDGMPVYQFETWGLGWSCEQLETMMKTVEKKFGEPVFWMCSGPAEIGKIELLRCRKAPGNSWMHLRNEGSYNLGGGDDAHNLTALLSIRDDRYWKFFTSSIERAAEVAAVSNRKRKTPLRTAAWIYPGFNNAIFTNTPHVMPDMAASREEYFVRSLACAAQYKPSIINLGAWNERREKSYLEPSWNNENPDPFYLVRRIAQMRGIEFKEPPLPAKENVDPWMWSLLYGIDRTPPRIDGIRMHCSEANMALDCLDDLAGVKDVAVSASPSALLMTSGKEIATFNCSVENPFDVTENGLKISRPGILKLKFQTGKQLSGIHVAVRYLLPEKNTLGLVLDFLREKLHAKYRLNGWNFSTVPNGPRLHGRGRRLWQVVACPRFSSPEDAESWISLQLTPGKASAYIDRIVVFPARIADESIAKHVLPSAGSLSKTFVITPPAKLLPRDFFDLPIAAQCFDAEGNASSLQIFEIPASALKESPGIMSIEACSYFWN